MPQVSKSTVRSVFSFQCFWPAVITFLAGGIGFKLAKVPSLFSHHVHDQHTLQAIAWLQGRSAILEYGTHQELVFFNNQAFSSFPPVSALFELPWVVLLGQNTPNHFSLLLHLVLVAVILQFLGLKRGWSSVKAGIVTLTYVLGTNLFPVAVQSGVWSQGQVNGFLLSVGSLALLLECRSKKGWVGSAFLLALAVGCRPFYLFYFPLWIWIWMGMQSNELLGKKKLNTFSGCIFLGSFPVLLALMFFNWIRFESPFEFGHRFLDWTQNTQYGLFSFHYLPLNFYHAWIHQPVFDFSSFQLSFDPYGTAFWINNPVFVFSVFLLLWFRKKLSFPILGTIVTVWMPLLMHESNGNAQFGYRYLIDLLPLSFLGVYLNLENRRIDLRYWVPLLIYSVAINLYGVFWYHSILT